MKIRLSFRSFDDDFEHPTTKAILDRVPNAYEVTEWYEHIFKSRGETISNKAILNDKGEPELITIRTPLKPDDSTSAYFGNGSLFWFKEGRNHKQIDDKTWSRELSDSNWYVDVETLEQLEQLFNKQDFDFSYDKDHNEYELVLYNF